MMRTLLLVMGGFAASLTFAAAAELSASDKAAIFKAAGFKAKGSTYMRCVDEAPSYMPGAIALQDMNGDGATEAFVTESSAFCYGGTEQAFVLLSKDSKDAWKTLLEESALRPCSAPSRRAGSTLKSVVPAWDRFRSIASMARNMS